MITDQQRERAGQMIKTPLSVINCPSRRQGGLHWASSENWHLANGPLSFAQTSHDGYVAQSDYAINAGHDGLLGLPLEPTNLRQNEVFPLFEDELGKQQFAFWVDSPTPGVMNLLPVPSDYIQPLQSGVSFSRSLVATRNIEDGASRTYLVGDKGLFKNYVHPADESFVEAANWSTGFGATNFRGGLEPPIPDAVQVDESRSQSIFGSAHPGGANISYCDGHVETVSYDIDADVHRHRAHRSDGGRPLRVDHPSEVMCPEFKPPLAH